MIQLKSPVFHSTAKSYRLEENLILHCVELMDSAHDFHFCSIDQDTVTPVCVIRSLTSNMVHYHLGTLSFASGHHIYVLDLTWKKPALEKVTALIATFSGPHTFELVPVVIETRKLYDDVPFYIFFLIGFFCCRLRNLQRRDVMLRKY